jgi:hypothetical protein
VQNLDNHAARQPCLYPHSIPLIDYFHLFWLICTIKKTCSSVNLHIYVWDCQSWKDFNVDSLLLIFPCKLRDLMGTISVTMHFQVFMFWANEFVLFCTFCYVLYVGLCSSVFDNDAVLWFFIQRKLLLNCQLLAGYSCSKTFSIWNIIFGVMHYGSC